MTSLFRRNVTSVTWLSAANWSGMVVLLGKSIMLARLLPVELFGIYALATSAITATAPIVDFGMGSAFLHRHQETEDEEHAAAVYFTLRLLFTIIWTLLLLVAALIFYDGDVRRAMMILVLIMGTHFAMLHTPRVILVRRVMHRRLAAIQMASDWVGTIAGVALAAAGAGIWALVSASVVNLAIGFIFLYVASPVWKPSLRWSPSTVRYLVGYGSRVVVADFLLRLLDTLDDIWTGLVLGSEQLGFYSRAYKFATYPRQVIAMPVNRVILGTYAELKDRRLQLSQAFFRSNALLIRAGFLMAGLLALVAPEMIRLLLTDKWLPMLVPFRLMLIFTLLDPIKLSIGYLFVAAGQPGRLVRVRFIQLAVLVVGLVVLGPLLGTVGVAVAVNLMLLVGTIILLWKAKEFVDYSVLRLFAAPTGAFLTAMLVSFVAIEAAGDSGPDWKTALLKGVPFLVGYSIVLITLERQTFRELAESIAVRLGMGSN